MGFLGGVLAIFQAYVLSHSISLVFLENQSLFDVRNLLIILLFLIIIRAIIIWGNEVFAKRVAVHIKYLLRKSLLAKIRDLGPNYCKGEQTGELLNTTLEGVESLDAYFSQYLPGLFLAAIIPLSVIFFVLPIDFLSAIVFIFTAPIIPIFMIMIGNLAQKLTQKQWQTLSRMSAYFLDILQGITTLKLLNRSKEQAKLINNISEKYRIETMNVLRITFLSALVLELVATLSTAVIAVEIGVRLLYGHIPFELAFFILLLAPEFYSPLRSLGARFHAGMSGVEAAKRIFQILETPSAQPQFDVEQISNPLTTDDKDPIREIVFKHVHLEYSDHYPILTEINFRIKPGQMIALVGSSGSGKTSIANLLLGFIKPQTGWIKIGEENLENIPLYRWQSQISWLSQNPYLFYGTIKENILLANPTADMNQIITAAKQANAHDIITCLPHGYDTIIGERGNQISGGQAQRIALARAFLRDSKYLILDEPTANLDPESEMALQTCIEKICKDRTVLIIAHRLNTIRKADKILVIDQGRIVQEGKHEELIRNPGIYQRLVQSSQDIDLSSQLKLTNEINQTKNQFLNDTVDIHSASFIPKSEFSMNYPSDELYKEKGKKQIKDILRLFGFIKPFIYRIALSVLIGFATIASGIGLMATSAYIISAAALHPSIAELQVAIVGVRFFGISRGVFRYLERYSSHQVTLRLITKLKVWFYESLEPLAPARLMNYRSGDLFNRISSDINSLENFYGRVIAPPLVTLLITILMFFFMDLFLPSLGFVILGLFFLAGFLIPIFIHYLSKPINQKIVDQQTHLSTEIIDLIQGLADLIIYEQAKNILARINHISKELGKLQVAMARINGLQNALIFTISNLSLWIVLFLTIPIVHSGKMNGIFLAVLSLAAITSFEAVYPLPTAAHYFERNLYSARRLFQIVDSEPEVRDPIQSNPLEDQIDLTIKKLNYSYPPSKNKLDLLYSNKTPFKLQDINLSLPRRNKMAIVGPSGSGKTTIVNLLNRFWDYSKGEIFLNQYELHTYSQDEIRQRIAVISQNTYLFNASILDNIRLAKPEASEDEIVRAAKLSEIHNFIQTLPQGYHTWIGEQGMRLSGGERQRIAIARTLLREPALLVLDEPTANLDTINEQKIIKSILNLMKKRSVLMITHRLIGMERMDEIIVLDNGLIVESGSHKDLLHRKGLYSRMWHLQNQIFYDYAK